MENRRPAGTSPETLMLRPRGLARGGLRSGGGGCCFRFLPWGRLRLEGVAQRAHTEAMRRGTAAPHQPGATTSSRGDPCWEGVWLGGCQGVLKLHLRRVGAAGGTLVGVAVRWYSRHPLTRYVGPPTIGVVSPSGAREGNVAKRAAISGAGGPASNRLSVGARTNGPRQAPSGGNLVRLRMVG